MEDIYAKKGEKVVFNGRYDLLPTDIERSQFRKGQVFTIAEDIDPGDSWSYVNLVEIRCSMGFNTIAFENEPLSQQPDYLSVTRAISRCRDR
jgi:hypothetical protein